MHPSREPTHRLASEVAVVPRIAGLIALLCSVFFLSPTVWAALPEAQARALFEASGLDRQLSQSGTDLDRLTEQFSAQLEVADQCFGHVRVQPEGIGILEHDQRTPGQRKIANLHPLAGDHAVERGGHARMA